MGKKHSKNVRHSAAVSPLQAATAVPWYARHQILLVGVALALLGGGAIFYDRANTVVQTTALVTSEREIPATPWPAEAHPESAPAPADNLGLMSSSMLSTSSAEIDGAVAAPQDGVTSVGQRIDGSSDEAMVESINQITAQLDEADARAFQKAVRILMVSSLPIDQFRAQRVLPENMTPAQLVSGGRQVLAGKTAVEVLRTAQDRINAYREKQAASAEG